MNHDCIESCPPPGATGRAHSHIIKSNHNMGGILKDMKLKLIEPLKLLFKDEIRQLGSILRVPDSFLKCHPFLSPGLAMRILGDVTEGNALDILRQLEFKVTKKMYSHSIVHRAVTSEDGMTVDAYKFECKFVDDVVQKFYNNVRGVNRVLKDFTSKPSSTIE
ncbi:hypothetical protein REPUB_Repub06bG0015300 [Reevesia pubescens]